MDWSDLDGDIVPSEVCISLSKNGSEKFLEETAKGTERQRCWQTRDHRRKLVWILKIPMQPWKPKGQKKTLRDKDTACYIKGLK